MSASIYGAREIKWAVVTGANKGIGYGICKQLISEGIAVVLTARDEKRGLDALEKIKQEVGFSDQSLLFHQLDVADPSSVASLADFIKHKIGKLDILVNNAGVGGATLDLDALKATAGPGGVPDFAKCIVQTYDSVAECFQINYYGAKRMAEAFIPLLQKSQSPRIVNVSSYLGKLKFVHNEWAKGILNDIDNLNEESVDEVVKEYLKDFKDGCLEAKGWTTTTPLPAYNVTKAAMNAYTRILAKKYPDMKVNCVCPGFVRTDINLNTGTLSVEEGAASPVRLALLPDDAPSGLFFVRDKISSFED